MPKMRAIYALGALSLGCMIYSLEGRTETPESPGLQPTFTSLKSQVFQPKCYGCHHGPPTTGRPIRGVPTFDLTQYKDVSFMVKPGDAEHSSLYQAVSPDGRMPLRGPKLTSDELNALAKWIDEGALDN